MLAATYLDRLTRAMGIRVEQRGEERRVATRIPASFRPEVYPVTGDRMRGPLPIRARDVSAGGIGLLLTNELVAAKTLVLRVSPRSGEEELVMLCELRRAVKLDSICVLGGFSFDGVLYPGQRVAAGQGVSSMLWVDVSGDKAGEDPFVEARRAG